MIASLSVLTLKGTILVIVRRVLKVMDDVGVKVALEAPSLLFKLSLVSSFDICVVIMSCV